jgi:ParB family chromosome partitioning protein
LQSARASGRMVVKVALNAIDENYLVRDRAALDPVEMDILKASLRGRGQQTPIEVVDLGGERLGLISGWRRLTALKALHADDPKGDFGQIQCLIKAPEASSDAYVAMVEENEIRTGLSFYERARIAARASEQGAFETPRVAAKALFGSVPRAKRSKIYSFLNIYEALDDVLAYPQALTEKLGLQLVKALEADGFVDRLRAALSAAKPENAASEIDVITKATMPPAKSAPEKQISEGVILTRRKDNLVLSGAGVDAVLEADLLAWLKIRLD